MNLDIESLQRQIPYYLTSEDRQILINELNAISRGETADYFLSQTRDAFKNDMLQGDGWRGFQLFMFDTGKRRSVQGLVISNSCDVDPNNRRDLPKRVIFAPLVKLATYEALLGKRNIKQRKIDEKLAAIRAQKTSSLFFLPSGGPLTDDHIVRLDEAHSMPVAAHSAAMDREKLFTLNNTGFYMLVLKLLIHFFRLQEKVNRV